MNEKFLGIELGSTRIKAVLIDGRGDLIASGSHEWENKLENGIWTYDLKDVWVGIQDAYAKMADQYFTYYKKNLVSIDGIGISAMMHGYLPFDSDDNQLVPFRTWRNTTTESASKILTEKFSFNIPQRWSIAHLYQAVLNDEAHIEEISYVTTLAGYVHYQLSGKKVLGVGEASGVFPIDSKNQNYNNEMLTKFNILLEEAKVSLNIKEVLPEVLSAGENAGFLTEKGARLLDPKGHLEAGVILCPPEGDAGTGMVATNSVLERTGNISAGTSIFAMIVLDEELSKLYDEIDMVTTPDGKPVAMVHCNSCTSDINAWINLFDDMLKSLNVEIDRNVLYETFFIKALEASPDCNGLLSYNYYAGEPITNVSAGRPMIVRNPDSKLSFANFARMHIFSSIGTLKIGMDILETEKVKIDRILGHGGFFKTPIAGQRLMASALNTPVAVMETAGEGGAWGMAILALYAKNRKTENLATFLENKIFVNSIGSVITPNQSDVDGFDSFMERYKKGLAIEKVAVEVLV